MKKSNSIQALWVGIGGFSSFLMTIVSSMILVRILTKSDFGTYRQVLYVYNSLLVLFTAGIPKAFTYFMPRFNLAKQKDIVQKITRTLFLLGAIFSITLYFSAPLIAEALNNGKLERSLQIFAPIPFFLLPTLGIEGIYSTLKKTQYIAFYQITSRLILLLSIVVPVVFFGGTYIQALYGWVISSFVLFIVALVFKYQPFKNVKKEESAISIKTIFLYSTPIMLASIYGVGTLSADQFFISRYFGEEVFAVYANGKLQLPFVGMILGAVAAVLSPVYSKLAFDEGNNKEISELWTRSLLKSATLIYPIVLFFMFYAKEIFVLLYGIDYEESGNYFIIFSLITFFKVIVFAPLVLGLGLTKFYSRIHLIEFIAIWVLGYAATKIFESPYAILSLAVLITIIKILSVLWYVSKRLELKFFDMLPVFKLLKYLIHGFAILVLVRFLFVVNFKIENKFLLVALSFLAYAIFLLGSSKWLKIDYLETLRPFLNKVPFLKNIFKKLKMNFWV